jgi:hypothetical protein
MNQLHELHKLKTIVLSEQNQKLKSFGKMGESFDEVLGRVLEQVKGDRQ